MTSPLANNLDTAARRAHGWSAVLGLAFVAGSAWLGVAAVADYLRLPCSGWTGGFSALLFFSLYVVNKYSDAAEDAVNKPDSAAYFSTSRLPLVVAVAALLGAVVDLVRCGQCWWFYLLVLYFGAGYSLRIVPGYRGGWTWIRLKEVGAAKPFFVAGVWTTCVVVVPLSFSHGAHPDRVEVGVLATALTILVFTNAVFCDILDMEGDEAIGLRTLPVAVGSARALEVLLWLGGGWLAVAAAGYLLGELTRPLLELVVVSAAFPLAYLLPFHFHRARHATLRVLCELDVPAFAACLALLAWLR